MMRSEMQQVEHAVQKLHQGSKFKEVISLLISTFVWAFLWAMVIGSLIAAIWTLVPTELLAWGANQPNLIGYVSHCSYTPISSITLFAASGVGVFLIHRFSLDRRVGLGMLAGILMGMATSLSFEIGGGVFLSLLIGMGIGIGFGFPLGMILRIMEVFRSK